MLQSIRTILDAEEDAITIRHLFYRLVGLHVIPKTELAYKNLCAHLSKWRRSGDILWGAFSDSTRWHIQAPTFDSMDEALANTVENYRRNLWATQPYYVEVWCEKDAVASILHKAAGPFGVPVFIARGFASLSSLYSAAATFRAKSAQGKTSKIFHFGDFDPSGVAAGQAIQETLRDDFRVEVEFERLAVTREQIETMSLPTRPVKMTDGRAKTWTGGECVELDTMPPAAMRKLVHEHVAELINPREWELMQTTEQSERETLDRIRTTYLPTPGEQVA
ncbi:MAG: hypothetical protein AB9869_37295 [Verrucomicrobiia bacterium]